MTELERCQAEIARCRSYAPDHAERLGITRADCDWNAEAVLIEREAYANFLRSKQPSDTATGFEPASLNAKLFDFQADITRWAIRRGRAAIFADCGLGKTPMQLEWAAQVARHTDRPVLIFAPLAVSQQTQREGEKFGIPVNICATENDIKPGVNVSNYEKLPHFPDTTLYGGIVLDESSILKGMDGKTRKALTEYVQAISFRLACTATPAPNDYMELGNHAEFLSVMTATEMLSMFFVHDGGETSKWRLKRHAEDVFWKWMASWAVAIRRPSDIGYEDGAFVLPPLEMHQITVRVDDVPEGLLFPIEGQSLSERNQARRDSITDRVDACAGIVNASDESWIVWCNLNAEGEQLNAAIPDAQEVAGKDTTAYKEASVLEFSRGDVRVLVSKPTIFGYGLNLQNCSHVAFVGLSDSYEQYYQAIRRCWRFGQVRPVHCYVITAETEGAVVRNIERKEQQCAEMMEGMVRHMRDEMEKNIRGSERTVSEYQTDTRCSDRWTAILGDCVEHVRAMSANSIDYSIFSPPFASLYTYSNSERDMGNSKDYAEFEQHFRFLVGDLHRVVKPGRLLSFHCMNLPISKQMEGFIGIRDFRGELIRMFIAEGWIFHSEVVIWKDPVTAMQRTKALGLLYKQLRKDSCMSRQGVPDYLVTMRKPGENLEPVTKTHDGFPVERWQRYASPVWMDINQSETLQRESAREEDDERHICPLQLQVIERAIELWTNPDDLVLSPFMGIGSEGHVALKMGRRFVGVELKRSYYEQAFRNLEFAEKMANAQTGLFAE